VLGRKLYAVKHQAEAGSGKPASDMLSGDISQRLERDLSGVRTFLYPEGLIGISMLPLS
jgi:hypothetical protein